MAKASLNTGLGWIKPVINHRPPLVRSIALDFVGTFCLPRDPWGSKGSAQKPGYKGSPEYPSKGCCLWHWCPQVSLVDALCQGLLAAGKPELDFGGGRCRHDAEPSSRCSLGSHWTKDDPIATRCFFAFTIFCFLVGKREAKAKSNHVNPMFYPCGLLIL